jgi:hypothetical protein
MAITPIAPIATIFLMTFSPTFSLEMAWEIKGIVQAYDASDRDCYRADNRAWNLFDDARFSSRNRGRTLKLRLLRLKL